MEKMCRGWDPDVQKGVESIGARLAQDLVLQGGLQRFKKVAV